MKTGSRLRNDVIVELKLQPMHPLLAHRGCDAAQCGRAQRFVSAHRFGHRRNHELRPEVELRSAHRHSPDNAVFPDALD